MSLPRSLRLLPLPAALVVTAVCVYVPYGLHDLRHPEVFDPGGPDMTGALAVLVGLGLTGGALVVSPVLLVVFTLGTVRVRAGSRRWHGALVFFCVPGVLLPLSSAPAHPVPLLLYGAGSAGCAVALLLPQTYRYLRAG